MPEQGRQKVHRLELEHQRLLEVLELERQRDRHPKVRELRKGILEQAQANQKGHQPVLVLQRLEEVPAHQIRKCWVQELVLQKLRKRVLGLENRRLVQELQRLELEPGLRRGQVQELVHRSHPVLGQVHRTDQLMVPEQGLRRGQAPEQESIRTNQELGPWHQTQSSQRHQEPEQVLQIDLEQVKGHRNH